MTFSKTSATSNRRVWSCQRDGIRTICILASFFIFAICVLPVANHPLKDETSHFEQSAEQLPPTDEQIGLESGSKNQEEPVENVREKRQTFDFNLNDQIDLSNLASLYNIDVQLVDGGQSIALPASIDLGSANLYLDSLSGASDVLQNAHFTLGDDSDFGNLAQTIAIGDIPGVTSDSGMVKIENGVGSPVTIYVGEISDGASVNGDQIAIGNLNLDIPVLEIDPNQVKFDDSDIRIIIGEDPQQLVHTCQGADCSSNAGVSMNVYSDVGLVQILLGTIDICQLSSTATNVDELSLDILNVQFHIPDASGTTRAVPIDLSISNGESKTLNLSEQDCRLFAQQYSSAETLNGYNINVAGDVTCSIVLPSLNFENCQSSPTTPAPTTTSTTTTTTTTPAPTTTSTTTTTTTTPAPTTTSTTTTTTTTPAPTTTSTTTTTTTTPAPTTTSTTTTTTPAPTTTSTTTTTTAAPTTQKPRSLRWKDDFAEPCEDFYQYACGGFEADPELEETDLEEEANKRILAESKTSNSPEAAQFTAYYESCLNYDERVSKSERTRLAIQTIEEVGKLFVEDTWPKDYDLTDLLINLIKYDSPILFDLNVDVDHRDSGKYIITLEPPSLKSPLFVNNEENECRVFEDDQEYTGQIDLLELHANYTNCKKHNSAAFHTIASVTQELLSSNSNNVEELKRLTQTLLNSFLSEFPTEDEVHYLRTSKSFEVVSVDDLIDEIGDVGIDWIRLLSTVTKTEVTINTKLQAYSFEKFLGGFNSIRSVSPMQINNALIALYIRNIYHELIVSRPANVEKYCMSVAKHLMRAHTSSLYLSSYSEDDLQTMNERVSNLFEDLRETLRLDVENVNEQAAWFGPKSYERISQKIKKLTLVQPDPSVYENNQADLNTNLSDNFFENTMKLRKNYRASLYDRLTKNRNDPKEIWNHFAVPYQTEALPLYGTNQIVIPYGWVGESSLLEGDDSPSNYSVTATLGHIIARQIAHQFDETSMKLKKDNFLADDSPAESGRENNLKCYKKNYEVPRSIMLPLSQHRIRYEITNRSADERFADAVALNLTYNTMLRLTPGFGEGNNDDVKQFFLDYAQMHCTKLPLTSSGASKLALQYLPSRIRLIVVTEQSRPFSEVFGCPQIQEAMCDVFPFIKPVEESFTPVIEAEQGYELIPRKATKMQP